MFNEDYPSDPGSGEIQIRTKQNNAMASNP